MKVAGSQRRADCAEAARVAPKTVYAVVGGKQGLLEPLVRQGVGAPVRSICQDHGDVIQLVRSAAPHDPVAADVLYCCFGPSSFSTLTRDNGWTFEEAERWSSERSASALLAPRAQPR